MKIFQNSRRAPWKKKRYIPRSPNAIITIFQNHFEDFKNNYPARYESEYGKYRLDRIVELVEGLLVWRTLRFFNAEDFIAEVTQHIPLPRVRLVR